MIFNRKNEYCCVLKLSRPLYALLFILFLWTPPVSASSSGIIFLPLHITTLEEKDALTLRVDSRLQEILTETSIKMIPRNTAETYAKYDDSWPPPVEILQKIADITQTDYIAAGNLTVIGNQISVDVKLFDILSPKTPTYYFQTAQSLNELDTALKKIGSEIQSYTERDFRISSIAPEGNARIDSGAILRKISTKSGDAYDPDALRNDLKSIYKMGYFNDVQIDAVDTPKGKKITFRVVEKPVIQSVIFEGIDELKEEDVRDAANIKEHFILNPVKISMAEETIRLLYKEKGFYNSKVTTNISYPNDKGAIVRFKIEEGKKIFIKEITVEGNTAFDDDELLDQIQTNEKWFLSWLTEAGLLDMVKVNQDASRIVTFYNNNGFLEAKVGEPEIRQEKEWIYLNFVVEEGPQFLVGTVDFSGDIIGTKEELLDLLTIRKEKYLSRQALREDIMKLTDYYAESGYAFAGINPVTKKSQIGNRIDINFAITQGELVYINRITIKGNSRTRDNVIRRELKVAEGGVFNSKALRQSTQALQRLMYFEEVNITPEPSLDPDRMNIIIEVKEKSTGTFSIGAGYSSVDNLILMGTISENNFLGRGDTLSLSGNVSGSSSRYNLGYTNPHLNDSALSWGLDLFNTNREYDDYTKDSKGGGIRIGYPIWGKWKVYGNYSYTDTDLTDVSENASYVIQNSIDLHITSAVKMSLVRDTRNRLYGASKGSRNIASIKYGGGPLGGDAQFTKIEGSTSWYFPMVWKTVFHIKGAAGQVFENETGKLPVYERFFLGGLNSVRGFEYGKISPIDPATSERIGGDKMWYTNVEVIFPLLETQGISGLVFYDSGQVLNDDQNFGEVNDSIKNAAGLGVRWLSPMGPLSIVWGYNLDPLSDEDQSVWDFSIGGTF